MKTNHPSEVEDTSIPFPSLNIPSTMICVPHAESVLSFAFGSFILRI